MVAQYRMSRADLVIAEDYIDLVLRVGRAADQVEPLFADRPRGASETLHGPGQLSGR